ncbi:glycosyltransferase family 4 protein [Mycolicibacterium flavescens]|uniref:glycosyltransferase family 4 protein n=1 Tax=Mycolicibacterium flavescens TaxID=1776 RepID=UPI000A031AB1|nr:glycosyltransferase family 4 protein [Mycolicibacterium flavescens]MCV7282582.1 glycosyltransferase family 4 protein [Mycolicibacterium flavescens]
MNAAVPLRSGLIRPSATAGTEPGGGSCLDKQISVTYIGINFNPEPLGIAPYASGLCHGLSERGYRVNVITGMPHYPEWRLAPEYRWKWTATEVLGGVPVKRVRHTVPKGVSNSRRLVMETTFGLRAVSSRWRRPDVIICTTPALIATAAVCLRDRTAAPRPALGIWVQDLYSLGVRELQGAGSPAAEAARRVEGWVLRQADSVVVAHNRFRSHLVGNLGVDPNRIETVPNWTHVRSDNTHDSAVMRRRLGWPEDETVVLHAGSMGVKQGLENVVQAAQLADRRKLKLRFVLVGDGNQRRALERLAGQSAHLEIRDPLPEHDFPAALQAADVLLLNEKPGVAEMSIPSKLTSYFQSGTSILAATSPESNAAQEVRKSGAGIVIDCGKPDLLVEAAISLGGNSQLRQRLGANGIRYAADAMGEPAALGRLDEWIRQLAAGRRTLTADRHRKSMR